MHPGAHCRKEGADPGQRRPGAKVGRVLLVPELFVVSADQVKGQELVFLNPRIVKKRGSLKEFEGCLSVPEVYEQVSRSKKVLDFAFPPMLLVTHSEI